ncbi:response regulator [Actinopolyspora saharensis]|uniref:DNA-binding response regulator, NarL/FixJ family, contains REC and HTH domains n=1 Tax=Actinopolyspora saharensis TaxID=995062 RepID=A0A1H0YSG3_9ACTN|nr:response regulator transcription factor [Actinopolyspora saharensis]SDQ18115.1 DNA-binding response regulator, NarL/FixJ family, contains REC and HTH domains [Actinopolyspora saharensis]
MTANPIRVIVADDQQITREGLVALLGLINGVEVVGSAADGSRVLELITTVPCDVVLMDLRMPVLDGVQATQRLRAEHPEIAVVVLTTYSDDGSISAALRAGALGYLTKDTGRGEIEAALRAAVTGQSTFNAPVSQRLVAALTDPAGEPSAEAQHAAREHHPPDGLTAREGEVLALIAAGLSNAEIAGELFIGEATVKSHINNAFAKIGARHRAEAVRYAYEHGLTRD